MAYKEFIVHKKYFRIGEVARALEVKCSKIRFWLSELKIETKRSRNGNRMLTIENILTLAKIKHMKTEGYAISGIRKNIGKYDVDENGTVQRIVI